MTALAVTTYFSRQTPLGQKAADVLSRARQILCRHTSCKVGASIASKQHHQGCIMYAERLAACSHTTPQVQARIMAANAVAIGVGS